MSSSQATEDLSLAINNSIPEYFSPHSTASNGEAITTILAPMCPTLMDQPTWNRFVRITNEAREAKLPNETRREALKRKTIVAVLKATRKRIIKEGFLSNGTPGPKQKLPGRGFYKTEKRPEVKRPPTPAGFTDQQYDAAWKTVREYYTVWQKYTHASQKRFTQGLANGDFLDDVVKVLKRRRDRKRAVAPAKVEDEDTDMEEAAEESSDDDSDEFEDYA